MGEDYQYVLRYLPLYRAALTDNWEAAEPIFDRDPDALTSRITGWWETALHIAVGTNCSHRFVENLVTRIAAVDITKLRTPNYMANSSLHYAAKAGNTRAARALVEKDPEMVSLVNQCGHTAVKLAAWFGRKETLVYLLGVTPHVIGEAGTSPYSGSPGGDLITLAITAGFYDVALKLIERHPNLATEKDRNGITALQTLATQPGAFPSGRSWWFWQYFIYNCIPLSDKVAPVLDVKQGYKKKPTSSWRKKCSGRTGWFGSVLQACWSLYLLVWKAVQYLVPVIKHIHETKLMHIQTSLLTKALVETVLSVDDHGVVWDVLGTAMSAAAKHGIHELIEECLGRYPGLIWYKIEGIYLFLAAITYRQVKVYNLVYQMTGHVVFAATNTIGKDNALHLAGRKVSPHRLSTVTGAALQMQRELQWFKEVEKFVEPSFKQALNAEKKTPRMGFTDEHMDLVEKGEKWMKDTASSSTVVAALIVTVAFAAIFTAPGGNKDDGTPYFLRDSTFMLFAISDALALFASVTSVLMFLSMLTSRYAEEDFLYALPKRITIGLVSLFISIAAIMVTFCAAMVLVLRKELAWIAVPVGLAACVPVTFFVMLQFPLLVELVLSTYGPTIFHKQNDLVLH
uniref:PGG domain-containing protein n=1 Tax=Kalanchoe fedtschenkoi TaxID=63787 RepID=A0A7N0T925_KALFE